MTANTPPTRVQASAPGSVMVAGEHAVLHGRLALCAAVNRRLSVTLTPRRDGKIKIVSALGSRTIALSALTVSPPFEFITAALVPAAASLGGGLELRVDSEFRHDLGLGSSAAVTVATVAALDAWRGATLDRTDLLLRVRNLIRAVQGRGSGADVAASVMGGVVAYRTEPLECRVVASEIPLVVVYSGSKEKTATVIAQVEARRTAHADVFEGLFAVMEHVSRDAEQAILAGDWVQAGALMNMGQGLMEAMGVGTSRLAELVYALRARPGIHGAKISGSGLGDCVIGLGDAGEAELPGERLAVLARGEGVCVDSSD